MKIPDNLGSLPPDAQRAFGLRLAESSTRFKIQRAGLQAAIDADAVHAVAAFVDRCSLRVSDDYSINQDFWCRNLPQIIERRQDAIWAIVAPKITDINGYEKIMLEIGVLLALKNMAEKFDALHPFARHNALPSAALACLDPEVSVQTFERVLSYVCMLDSHDVILNPCLLKAVENKDLPKVTSLLAAGASPDTMMCAPIIAAVRDESRDILVALLDKSHEFKNNKAMLIDRIRQQVPDSKAIGIIENFGGDQKNKAAPEKNLEAAPGAAPLNDAHKCVDFEEAFGNFRLTTHFNFTLGQQTVVTQSQKNGVFTSVTQNFDDLQQETIDVARAALIKKYGQNVPEAKKFMPGPKYIDKAPALDLFAAKQQGGL